MLKQWKSDEETTKDKVGQVEGVLLFLTHGSSKTHETNKSNFSGLLFIAMWLTIPRFKGYKIK